MSYEIVYARNFIKVSNGNIIPLVLMGSNNCSEYINGREVLERHWNSLFKDMIMSPTDILSEANKLKETSQYSELFKWHGKWITTKEYPRWLQCGIKNAATVEQYLKYNSFKSLAVRYTLYNSSKNKFEDTDTTWIKTTLELEDAIKHYNSKGLSKIKKDTGRDNYRFYITIEWTTREALCVPDLNINKPFCVKCKHGYLIDIEPYSINFKTIPDKDIKIFTSVEEFEEYAGVRLSNLGNINVRFIRSDSVFKKKNFIVVIKDKDGIRYFVKNRKHRVLTNYNNKYAKKFSSKSEANRMIDKICTKLTGGFYEFEVRDLTETKIV